MVVTLTRVGLLGSGAADAAGILRDVGGDPVVGDAAYADADVLVALGEDALLEAVTTDVDVPVLPVAAGREYGGVPREGVERALTELADDEYETRDRRTLAAAVDGSEHRGLADATLVTSEPAQISEFEVRADDEHVDEVRADGVVAATPAGSHGYAAATGGPLLQAGADAVSVVPIAPFRVERLTWVLDPPVELTVTREESAVSVFVDGRKRGSVAPDETVELDWGAPFTVAAVSNSEPAPRFDDRTRP